MLIGSQTIQETTRAIRKIRTISNFWVIDDIWWSDCRKLCWFQSSSFHFEQLIIIRELFRFWERRSKWDRLQLDQRWLFLPIRGQLLDIFESEIIKSSIFIQTTTSHWIFNKFSLNVQVTFNVISNSCLYLRVLVFKVNVFGISKIIGK